ncbi:beta-ketoacyl synthase N-terminal-like domain-containing protein [Saccharopolyspora sp. 5N708]|uniref:beta-ketoacyl synthase N-terminal-like domain-containing protein n=1 Tax=Saccharopolyspora sp. 5N708 TaxID=3457424 RepID=UPI003FD0122A
MTDQAPLVTGMAWCTPLGSDLDQTWRHLCAGHTALRPQPAPFPVRNQLVAAIPETTTDPGQRQVAITASTLRAACTDAGINPADPSVQLVLGTSYAGHLDDPDTTSLHDWARESAHRAGHPREPLTITTACSAGADSLLVGAELIRTGTHDICVCGGTDVLSTAKRLGHTALGTMSPTTPRAFDRRHDGMVLGEGAAFLVLESPRSAHRRRARTHAALAGAGSANDAAGLTAPDESGTSILLAIGRSLADSGLTPADIAVISAHGTATPLNDAVEATSLATLFADQTHPPVVFGTKGALGHSLGATGAIEAVSLVLALRDQLAPPIAGTETPTTELPLALGEARSFHGTAGASITLGFGGFNTCLLFARIEDGDA